MPVPVVDEQYGIEWKAWGAVVAELEGRGIEINAEENESLIFALQRWGEEIATLRRRQNNIDTARRLMESREKYPRQA